MKKASNQSGFAVIEAMLVVVILAILGFTGWFVWHSKQVANNALNTANKAASSQITHKATTAQASSQSLPQVKLSAVPALQASVIEHLKTTHACLNATGQIINEVGKVDDPSVSLIINNSARVGVCQAVAIYVFREGQWQFVESTQGAYMCTLLQQYKVPASLIADRARSPSATCEDANGAVETYQG